VVWLVLGDDRLGRLRRGSDPVDVLATLVVGRRAIGCRVVRLHHVAVPLLVMDVARLAVAGILIVVTHLRVSFPGPALAGLSALARA